MVEARAVGILTPTDST